MNPVTQGILKRIQDPDLRRFVEDWDRLERLVIDVYKSRQSSTEIHALHHQVKNRLERDFPRYQAALEPYWHKIRVEGVLLTEDPFRFVLRVAQPEGWIDNWPIMQQLPAAREALNHYLMDLAGLNRDFPA